MHHWPIDNTELAVHIARGRRERAEAFARLGRRVLHALGRRRPAEPGGD